MRIAQVLPRDSDGHLAEPRLRAVAYLTEDLARRGHEVAILPALRGSGDRGADIVHVHAGSEGIPGGWRPMEAPALVTFHDGLGPQRAIPARWEKVAAFGVCRRDCRDAAPMPMIENGLPEKLYGFREGRGGYLAVMGPIRMGEGIGRAIEIARRAGRRILISARPEEIDVAYFRSDVQPLLADPHVSFVGPVDDDSRNDFFGDAFALLRPAVERRPPELTAVEAMSCGTPVVACGAAAAEDAMEQGVTGFAASTVAEAADAIRRVESLSRRRCREAFERRHTSARMADEYLNVYRTIRGGHPAGARPESAQRLQHPLQAPATESSME